MHKDIIIGNADAETVARWIAAKITEVQWFNNLSPTETFTTEQTEMIEPSRETWGYLIRLHGQIERHTPRKGDLGLESMVLVQDMRQIPDVMRCEIRQGGSNPDGSKRSQVVIDCERYVVGSVLELMGDMGVVFDIIRIEGDQVGDIRPGGTQSIAKFMQWALQGAAQPAETSADATADGADEPRLHFLGTEADLRKLIDSINVDMNRPGVAFVARGVQTRIV